MIKRPALTELQNVESPRFEDDGRSKSSASSSEEEDIQYKRLLAKGKQAAAQGDLGESLTAFKKAYQMKKTEKILKRIQKVQELLDEIQDENDDFVELDNGLIIYRQLVERLYPHQIEGVKWIYNLFQKKKKGGILADDMGLGKTIQVIAALSAMFDMDLIRHVLLVLPLSLIPNWQKEFDKWAPGIKVKCFHGSPRERNAALDHIQRRSGVCMTTYGLIQTQFEQLGQTKYREEFRWDYIVLDEGHKIKNPTKTTKGLHAIPSKNRIILTGTPIQNNLRELWALFDWIMQGTLLGTQKTFKMHYEGPITKARQRGASSAEIHLGNKMSESLRKIVDPYIMRRTKGSVSAPKPGGSMVDKNQSDTGDVNKPSFPKLKRKNDFVIWTYLSKIQEGIYRDFLQQDGIKRLLASKRSPLVYLNILKKICDHPRLLSRKACHELGLEANDSLAEEDFHSDKGKECAANRIDNISDETLIMESGKLQFLIELLQILKQEGHRTLIFSLSRKVLNVIHRILINKKFKVMRLDGTITKLSERELRVSKFQNDSSYEVFLLTTQVGGVGLTLTAADRVVIFDPSWNPATDAQAVDRIYRIGQEKNVVVYRLITCGTVEEKIYRRQIFKDSIIKQSTGDNKDPYRYFTTHELRELFELGSMTESVTQRQLQDLHGGQRNVDPKLADHLARIHTLSMFGVSDHDLMFSQDPDDVDPNMMEEHKDAIRNQVAQAQVKVEFEAKHFTGNEGAEARWGDFDLKVSVPQPKVSESEPTYPVEGLYDDLGSLKIDDQMIEDIFHKSKDQLDIPSSGMDDVILVADSPTQDVVGKADSRMTEVEESFISDGIKSTENTPSKALFQADLSNIGSNLSSNNKAFTELKQTTEHENSPKSLVEPPVSGNLDESTDDNKLNSPTMPLPSDNNTELLNVPNLSHTSSTFAATLWNNADLNETEADSIGIANGVSVPMMNNENYEADLTKAEEEELLASLSDESLGPADDIVPDETVLNDSDSDDASNVSGLIDDDSHSSNDSILQHSVFDAPEPNNQTSLDESTVFGDGDVNETNLSTSEVETSEKVIQESVPETPTSKTNDSHAFTDELPDFDEEEYATVSHTRKLSMSSKVSSDNESMQDEEMRLKLDDYNVEDFNLENSDEEIRETSEENPSILDSPVNRSRKSTRLISESTEDEDDMQDVNSRSVEKKKMRRRSSAAPLRSFHLSDDSTYSINSRRDSCLSTVSRVPSSQLSFESSAAPLRSFHLSDDSTYSINSRRDSCLSTVSRVPSLQLSFESEDDDLL